MIACVRIPQFAAVIEVRNNPDLGTGPLVVVEKAQKGERVCAVSEAGYQAGIRAGMSLRHAQLLCPQGSFLFANHARYRHAFDTFLEVLGYLAPDVEPDALYPCAIAYLDLVTQKNRGPFVIAQDIGQTIREKALLSPALGLAGKKFAAYMAAVGAEPNEALIIAPGEEKYFLAPLPLDNLPLDKETLYRLNMLGIRTMGQLAVLPAGAVASQFGHPGSFYHKLANGEDDRPIVPRRLAPGEQILYQCDGAVEDRRILENIIRSSITDLTKRLQDRALATQQIRLVLQLEDGTAYHDMLTMGRPSCNREKLARAVIDLAERANLRSGVVGLEIYFDQLVPVIGHQLALFDDGSGQGSLLRDVFMSLSKRYESHCFYRISLNSADDPVLEFRFRFGTADDL